MQEASRLAQALVAVCICACMLRGQNDVAAPVPRKADASTDSFLTELQRIVNLAGRLEDASPSERESILREEPLALQEVLRGYLQDGKWDSRRILETVKRRVGEKAFHGFVSRFGIDAGNQRDQIWEFRSQLVRFSRQADSR